MHFRFITNHHLFIIALLFWSSNCLAQVQLINIHHEQIADSIYQIAFAADQRTSFKVLTLGNPIRIAVDLHKTAFDVQLPSKKLDGRFVKNIRRAQKGDYLRMSLELAPNTSFKKTFYTLKNGQLAVVIQLKNDFAPIHNISKIIAPAKEKPKPQIPAQPVLKIAPPKVIEPIKAEPKSSIITPQTLPAKLTNPSIKPGSKIPFRKKYVVMIDAGHGGIDKGTIGNNLRIIEKKLVLSYGMELRRELSKYPQYKVMMTRDRDVYMSLEARKKKARNHKADLFISLHADFHHDQKMQGASVYTLSQQALDQESFALSERENKVDILKDDKLLKQNQAIASVLIDMVYQNTKNASVNLAKYTTEELSKEVLMLQKSHRSAGFKVLKGVDIPAILVELGYLSNPEEEKKLISHAYKQQFIQALVQGINRYTCKK